MQLLKTTMLCGLSEDTTRTLHTAGAKSSRPGQRVPLPPVTTQLPPCPYLGDNTILSDMPSPVYILPTCVALPRLSAAQRLE